MIGKIKGSLSEIEGNVGLIETSSGVFYTVFLTPELLKAHSVNSKVEIYTYFHVREDSQILFGFQTKKQQQLFKILLSISGVGPKTAFSILSFSREDELWNAVKENSVEFFSRVPGLGRKTAMKIVLELSQVLKQEVQLDKLYLSEEDKTVIDALLSLGFKAQDAKTLLSQISKELPIEEKIKEALRLTSKKV